MKGYFSEQPLDFVGQFWPDLFSSEVLVTVKDVRGNWENWCRCAWYNFSGVFPFNYGGVGVVVVVDNIDDVDSGGVGVEVVDINDFNGVVVVGDG